MIIIIIIIIIIIKLCSIKKLKSSLSVENPDHCDFIFLRNNLIRTHMQDLKDVTNNELYENFRCQKLAAVTSVNLDNKLASSNRFVALAT